VFGSPVVFAMRHGSYILEHIYTYICIQCVHMHTVAVVFGAPVVLAVHPGPTTYINTVGIYTCSHVCIYIYNMYIQEQ